MAGTTRKSIAAIPAARLRRKVLQVWEDDLHSRWTTFLAFKQLLLIEELMAPGRLELYNRMKPWITQNMITVEEKNLPRFETTTPRGFLAFSNYNLPNYIEEDDRRWCIYKSPAQKRDADYYGRLFGWASENLGAVLHYLQTRAIDAFDPHENPPMTAAKANAIKLSRPPLVQEIEDMMEGEVFPFVGDLFTTDELRRALGGRMGTKPPTPRAIGEALEELKAMNLGQSRLADDKEKKIRLWAWRNQQQWENASGRERVEHWQKHRAPSRLDQFMVA